MIAASLSGELAPGVNSVYVERMRKVAIILSLPGLLLILGAESDPLRPPPGQLEPDDLKEYKTLPEARKVLVREALEIGRRFKLADYIYGSAEPDRGGFDCSGAIHYLLEQLGIQAPRTSAAQFDWVKRGGGLVDVPPNVHSHDHPVFERLEPGDLLFWSGTYSPTDDRRNRISHVQMYLGREVDGGGHVMIGSTDGRSYRGTARCGYGVYDFKLPREDSKKSFVGFGPPPELEDLLPKN